MKNVQFIAISLMVLTAFNSQAQNKCFTRSGKINFFSKTTAENIDANNNEVFSMIDPQKNQVAFQVLNTGFKFQKALMQEHFNENYIESAKYPKTSFQGVIADPSKVDFGKDGNYDVTVEGNLTIHGVTKKISVPASIHVSNSIVTATSKFTVKLADYNIKIPSLVANQISENIAISVDCAYDPYTR